MIWYNLLYTKAKISTEQTTEFWNKLQISEQRGDLTSKNEYMSRIVSFRPDTQDTGAEEGRLHEVALTAMKVVNDPHLLPYPL